MGKSTPAMAWIRLRSPPCGYFVFIAITRTRGLPAAACCIAAMATGLLSSMAITPSAFANSRSVSCSPSTISLAFTRISWSLQVR